MSCLPENQHLGWVRVTFLDDFSSLSWASIMCNQAEILICCSLSLLQCWVVRNSWSRLPHGRGHVCYLAHLENLSFDEDIGSFRGELLERLQEKREGLWKKWETEVSKLEGGWRPWRWWPGRPYARSVGLGAHCPAHRRLCLSKAVRSRWAGYLNTTDSQHWQHCSGVSHNWIFLDPIGSLASSVYIISNVQCVMCNM